jgi:predicted dehydrogenase
VTPETDARVALIGYGLAGAVFHAPFIAATPGLRLAVVVTQDPERRTRAVREHPRILVVETVDWLWHHPREVDLVVIASPNRTHVPFARAALAAGLPVVVDKPLAATAQEGQQLIDEARRCGGLLTVFQNRRWDGDFLTVKRLLGEGALGVVSRFESRFERWRPAPPDRGERSAAEDAGGILYDLGSHLIDQALLLFGPAKQVYAELDRRRPGVETDDDTFVALAHASGVRSHLWMSAVAAQRGPRFRVLGSQGAYTKWGLDVQEEALRAGGRPDHPGWGEEAHERWGQLGIGDAVRPVRTEAGSYQRFYAGVVAALREAAPPPVDPVEVVAGLEVISAAQRSAAESRVVALTGL